jgi:hypothetical protein
MSEAKFGMAITDDLKVQALKMCLDPTNQQELLSLKAQGVTFGEYWAKLEGIYGRDDGLTARGRWKACRLHNPGKLTVADWRQYEINFKTLWADVIDATENEAYELLISTMPPNFRTNIFEEEQRKFGHKTLVKVCNIGELTGEEAKFYFKAFLGIECPKVEKTGDSQYLATFDSREQANKLLAYHGRRTEGTPLPIVVQVLDQHLKVVEVFDSISSKLASRDRSETWSYQFYTQNQERSRTFPRRQNAINQKKIGERFPTPPPLARHPHLMRHPATKKGTRLGRPKRASQPQPLACLQPRQRRATTSASN